MSPAELLLVSLGGCVGQCVAQYLSLRGLSSEGLPLGLQLIGRPFEEETLFALGAVIEQAAGHFQAKPWWR